MGSFGPEGHRGKRVRILVIDDDPTVLKTFVRVLGTAHEVGVALDPTVGIAAIEAGVRFHIIFCDMAMPVLSGIDVYAQIERIDAKQARRTVFLTGDDSAAVGREFLERTGILNLEKPIVPSVLHSLVRRILR